jgi:hypothetical protein
MAGNVLRAWPLHLHQLAASDFVAGTFWHSNKIHRVIILGRLSGAGMRALVAGAIVLASFGYAKALFHVHFLVSGHGIAAGQAQHQQAADRGGNNATIIHFELLKVG